MEEKKDVYKDAYGFCCDKPIKCWECEGKGVIYGEMCLTCGGDGELCDPNDLPKEEYSTTPQPEEG